MYTLPFNSLISSSRSNIRFFGFLWGLSDVLSSGHIHQKRSGRNWLGYFLNLSSFSLPSWFTHRLEHIGLPICKRLVEAMGGHIHCRSKLGIGSTFSFDVKLPSAHRPSAQNQEKVEEVNRVRNSGEQLAGIKVLLVEDNLINQKVGVRLLHSLGCQVQVAVNGRECIEILQRSHHPHFRKEEAEEKEAPPSISRTEFDIILMDCQMPEMDGFEATAHIRQMEQTSSSRTTKEVLSTKTRNHPGVEHIPIVALTASVTTEYKEKCLESGMDDFLSKVSPTFSNHWFNLNTH